MPARSGTVVGAKFVALPKPSTAVVAKVCRLHRLHSQHSLFGRRDLTEREHHASIITRHAITVTQPIVIVIISPPSGHCCPQGSHLEQLLPLLRLLHDYWFVPPHSADPIVFAAPKPARRAASGIGELRSATEASLCTKSVDSLRLQAPIALFATPIDLN